MKVLVVCAHPDDEVLGMGGTIRKYADSGIEVSVGILNIGSYRTKAKKVVSILGIEKEFFEEFPDNRFYKCEYEIIGAVEGFISIVKPDVIFTHYPDNNQDHRVVSQAVKSACRRFTGEIHRFICYPYAGSKFIPNWFMDIDDQMTAKVNAMLVYSDRIREDKAPVSQLCVCVMNEYWGVLSKFDGYAEGFRRCR